MQTLVIPGNFLHPGMKYRLVLNASYRDDGGWSEAFYEFSTNFPPYGGDCSYAVQKGLFIKLLTFFSTGKKAVQPVKNDLFHSSVTF